jgi:hypothetical protein
MAGASSRWGQLCGIGAIAVLGGMLSGQPAAAAPPTDSLVVKTADPPDPMAVAAEVDRLILAGLEEARVTPAGQTSDEDFLRRVCLDLAGRLPTPREILLFGLDPDPQKRTAKIEELLTSDSYAENWAHYWRDVIFTDATNSQARLMQEVFERWMADQLKQNRPWNEVTAELLTATGDIQKNGATALILVRGGEPAEIAAEASRIFLGIQVQCANCHDHPTDGWKRQQFHELAAYFPRISLRQTVSDGRATLLVSSVNSRGSGFGEEMRQNPERFIAMLDRNRDGKLSKEEAGRQPQFGRFFEGLLRQGDTDKDGALTAAEMKRLPPPQQQGSNSLEYFMPDLNDPASKGTAVEPIFFIDGSTVKSGLDDLSRRKALVESLTSPGNRWFAQAFVNRMWNELLGEGFYMPVDDLGPQRQPRFPAVLDVLSEGFSQSGYDIRWLLRTISITEAYQRKVRVRHEGDESLPFAAALPTRLRADQLYTSLTQVLEVRDLGNGPARRRPADGQQMGQRSPRVQFDLLFAIDPSIPREDVTGNVPQALYLLNSPELRQLTRASGDTRLGRLLRAFPDDRDAISELYLAALCREPTSREEQICLDYIGGVENRAEALEDLFRGLLNSAEFLSRR